MQSKFLEVTRLQGDKASQLISQWRLRLNWLTSGATVGDGLLRSSNYLLVIQENSQASLSKIVCLKGCDCLLL